MSRCWNDRELSHAAADKAWDMAEREWKETLIQSIMASKAMHRQEAKEAAAGLVAYVQYMAHQDNETAIRVLANWDKWADS